MITPSPILRAGRIAFLLAGVAVAGSLWLTLALGLKACPLCLYQRTFAFGVFAVLMTGLLIGEKPGRASLFALPLAAGGVAVAIFHVYLEMSGKLECPPGIAGLGSTTQQALVMLLLLVVVVGIDAAGATDLRLRPQLAVPVLLVLGVALGVGSLVSAPPLPPRPTSPYTQPLDGCRPPFSG